MPLAPPRYSSRPLPRTAFLPGISRRAERPAPAPPRPEPVDYDRLAEDDTFRHGVDLFNHGFPWEAHEVWEQLWSAAPRDRPERALLHALIHAAAAAIKARTGDVATARRFLASASGDLARAPSSALDLASLIAGLTAWAADPAAPPPRLTLRSGPTGRD